MWGFAKIRGTFLGAPILRIIIFGVYIGVPLFWESSMWQAHGTCERHSCRLAKGVLRSGPPIKIGGRGGRVAGAP